MRKVLCLFGCLLIVAAIHGQGRGYNHKPAPLPDTSFYKHAIVRAEIFPLKDKTYGYDIFVNSILYVHQPAIPCLPGKKGFKTAADAKKVTVLVITKIKNGLIPPSVTISEMQKLGIDLR